MNSSFKNTSSLKDYDRIVDPNNPHANSNIAGLQREFLSFNMVG